MSEKFPFSSALIDHMGIAVRSIKKTEEKYRRLWGHSCFHYETIADQKVKVGFIQTGNIKLELIESTSNESTIDKFIEKRGEGLHHMAYMVNDIFEELERLKELNFRLIDKKPRKGAMNKLVAFIHPKEMNGVLIEICQKIKELD